VVLADGGRVRGARADKALEIGERGAGQHGADYGIDLLGDRSIDLFPVGDDRRRFLRRLRGHLSQTAQTCDAGAANVGLGDP
jgi:hypothetical protein